MNWKMRALVAAFAAVAAAPTLAADPPYTVVADGLQSPRGLAFGPGGRLYVGQSGNGDGQGNSGFSGKISEIRNPLAAQPVVRDLVTGLPSISDGGGGFSGPNGISAMGNGTIYAVLGTFYTDPPFTPGLQGHVLKVNQSGQVRDVANVADFDFAWFKAHPELGFEGDHMVDGSDANPYGLLALGSALYVADSATNTLGLVRPSGAIQILAYFPDNVIADATPTCIAQGPDGALYVGTLALVDSLVFGPSAIVYRVDLAATDPSDFDQVLHVATPWATGLWPINGCAFGADGSLYVSELITHGDFSGGEVVKIPFATPNVHTGLTGDALAFPGGVAVGPDGSVYVSNGTAFIPGQVLRLTNR